MRHKVWSVSSDPDYSYLRNDWTCFYHETDDDESNEDNDDEDNDDDDNDDDGDGQKNSNPRKSITAIPMLVSKEEVANASLISNYIGAAKALTDTLSSAPLSTTFKQVMTNHGIMYLLLKHLHSKGASALHEDTKAQIISSQCNPDTISSGIKKAFLDSCLDENINALENPVVCLGGVIEHNFHLSRFIARRKYSLDSRSAIHQSEEQARFYSHAIRLAHVLKRGLDEKKMTLFEFSRLMHVSKDFKFLIDLEDSYHLIKSTGKATLSQLQNHYSTLCQIGSLIQPWIYDEYFELAECPMLGNFSAANNLAMSVLKTGYPAFQAPYVAEMQKKYNSIFTFELHKHCGVFADYVPCIVGASDVLQPGLQPDDHMIYLIQEFLQYDYDESKPPEPGHPMHGLLRAFGSCDSSFLFRLANLCVSSVVLD